MWYSDNIDENKQFAPNREFKMKMNWIPNIEFAFPNIEFKMKMNLDLKAINNGAGQRRSIKVRLGQMGLWDARQES